jgi:hypothetical protein
LSHDVFISHSSLDKLAADAICHGLEARGVRCWIAPRDQLAGRAYGEQITAAITSARVMVLVFSDNVNNSQAVLNEINIAVGANVTIVPFRIAKVDFNSELHFYLGRMHWLDAFPPPVDAYIDTLIATIQRNLPPAPAGEAAAPPPPGAAPIAPPPQPTPPAPPPVAAQRGGVGAGTIVGGVLGALFLILLIVLVWPRPAPPGANQAANTVMQAIANSIARESADDSDDDDKPAKPASIPAPPAHSGNAVTQ